MTMPSLPRRAFLLSAISLLATVSSCAGAKQDTPPPPAFTDAEREVVRRYWNAADRYTILPAPGAMPRQNITVEGSTWYWSFVRAVAALKKTDPATALTWQRWWDAFYAAQKAQAVGAATVPPDPGPALDALITAVGSPCPALFERVTPTRYTVTFSPADAPAPFVYEDAIDFAARPAYYAYYRQKNGVIRAGKHVTEYAGDAKKRIDALFAKAGRSPFEQHVLQAVSRYEGGFEAINTYDTGFVSVGFLQFITAIDGTGSLSEVLRQYKTDAPIGFQGDFRRFGIDVAADGVVVCVDPATGSEARGAEAVRRLIDDKRLTAVFERAAAGDGFRLAQVAVARSHYWPADDMITLALPLPPIRVGDVIRSEAGIATLMDRKVNRGNIRDLSEVAQRVVTDKGIRDPRDLAKYERMLVVAMKYRGDFLADLTLTQPPPNPATPAAPGTSRSRSGGSLPETRRR